MTWYTIVESAAIFLAIPLTVAYHLWAVDRAHEAGYDIGRAVGYSERGATNDDTKK